MKRRALFLEMPLSSKTNKTVETVVGSDSTDVKFVLFKVGENDLRVDSESIHVKSTHECMLLPLRRRRCLAYMLLTVFYRL